MVGLEVDGVELVVGSFYGVVVGEVVECVQYLNVDKLCVIKVNVGGDCLLDIVCGVLNCCQGLCVVVVIIGVVLLGDFKIKVVKLCGELFEGMLCFFFELGIFDDYSGIIELFVDVLIGIDICEYLKFDDNIIEISVMLNCVDCLGIIGVVCDVVVLNQLLLVQLEIVLVGVIIDDMLLIIVEVLEVCLCYFGCVVKGINVKVLILLWMKEKLCCCGICFIDVVVDVINYVLFELGQLMYVFDKDCIEGGIVVWMVKEGEMLVLFDGIEVKLNVDILVIVDYNKVLVMGGIFGGEYFGVNDEI